MKKAFQLALALLFVFSFSTSVFSQSSTQELPERYIEATYENATVYTGNTDYAFKLANGNVIQFSYSNLEESQAWNPVMPNGMLESGENLDGLPGPNPELVGKTFLLIYGGTGDMVTEVRLKD